MVAGSLGIALAAIGDFIVNIAIPLHFALAIFVFLFGVLYYFVIGALEDDFKEEGRRALLWANLLIIVGIAVWGVMEGIYFLADIELEVVDSQTVQNVPNVPQVPR